MNTLQIAGMVAGNIAFAISAAAYAMRNIIWLRILALVSLSLSLFYNATLPAGPLWLVLFWLCVFIAIHLYRVVGEIRNVVEVPLSALQKRVHAHAFPTMHSADVKRIWEHGTVREVAPGAIVLQRGDPTDALSLLLSGQMLEHRADGRSIRRTEGTMWGELTYMIGRDELNASPCEIVAGEEGARVFSVDYADMASLSANNPRLRSALYEGFVRSAGVKHGLLEMHWFDRNRQQQAVDSNQSEKPASPRAKVRAAAMASSA